MGKCPGLYGNKGPTRRSPLECLMEKVVLITRNIIVTNSTAKEHNAVTGPDKSQRN